MKLVVRQFALPVLKQIDKYTLSGTENSIYSGAVRIIGSGYPGDTLALLGLDTELSSPNALVLSGTHLYIADTMNDRVLSYDTTNGQIIQLL